MNISEQLQYAFEGIDGGGKSTNIRMLADHYAKQGYNILTLATPGRNFIGRTMRNNLFRMDTPTKERMFVYDIKRTQRIISPEDEIILWDRHLDSIYASNDDSDEERVEHLASNVVKPSKVFFIDIPIELSWDREQAGKDHPISYEWLKRKYDRYQKLLNKYPERIMKIDGNRELIDVFTAIKTVIDGDLVSNRLAA